MTQELPARLEAADASEQLRQNIITDCGRGAGHASTRKKKPTHGSSLHHFG